jgi:hypothetical protein
MNSRSQTLATFAPVAITAPSLLLAPTSSLLLAGLLLLRASAN